MVLRTLGTDSGECAAGTYEKDAWSVLMAPGLGNDPLYLIFLPGAVLFIEIFPPCDFRKLPE